MFVVPHSCSRTRVTRQRIPIPNVSSHSVCQIHTECLLGGSLENGQRLGNLRREGIRRLNQVENFRLVHFEQHTGDLRGVGSFLRFDERVESFTENHTLLIRRRRGELGGENSHRVGRGSLGRHRRHRHDVRLVTHVLTLAASAVRATTATSAALGTRNALTLGHRHPVPTRHTRHARTRAARHDRLETKAGLRLRRHHARRRLTVVHGRTRDTRRRHVRRHTTRHTTDGTLSELRLETHAAFLLALRESNVQGLGANHLAVHFRHGTSGFVGRRERHEGRATRSTRGVAHDAARGDGTKLLEQLTELFIVRAIFQVLDVQVRASHLFHAFTTLGIELRLQFSFTLSLLLRAAHDPRLFILGVAVEILHRRSSTFRRFEAHKAKALGLAFFVLHDDARRHDTVFSKLGTQAFVRDGFRQVFHVDIVELGLTRVGALGATLERSDVHLLVVQLHAIDIINRRLRRLSGFKLHKAIPLRVALPVHRHLGRRNRPKLRKRIQQRLVINILVQVLDEDIPDTRSSHRRVALRIQHPDRLPIDHLKIQHINRVRRVIGALEIHIRVPERAARDQVAADANGNHGPERAKLFVQLRLGDGRFEITHV
mmetsp:Transcript_7336/g.24627  ORF Transcript_7336/g.24627 Transcript_7336/m.24627 type:complete len:601 (+) Transcript_7336:467-2269(+)